MHEWVEWAHARAACNNIESMKHPPPKSPKMRTQQRLLATTIQDICLDASFNLIFFHYASLKKYKRVFSVVVITFFEVTLKKVPHFTK
jgi:hypothetical protein